MNGETAVSAADLRMFCLTCRRTLHNDDRATSSRPRDTVTGDHDLRIDRVTVTHDGCGGSVAFSRRSVT